MLWRSNKIVTSGVLNAGAPILDTAIIDTIITDTSGAKRGVVVESLTGKITIVPTTAPAANEAGIVIASLFHGLNSNTSVQYDITTSNGRTKMPLWRGIYAYPFQAAPVAGIPVPTGELNIRTHPKWGRAKMRSDDDSVTLFIQVLPVTSVQAFSVYYSIDAIIRVP